MQDPDAKQPAYLNIVEVISDRITAGRYQAGARLPSSVELCAEFGVSPMTVRRALTTLRDQGLVSCIRGTGTFVRSLDLGNSTFKLGSVEGPWLDESAGIRLLSVDLPHSDARIAERLGIEVGQRVVCVRRLVSFEGGPAMLHTEYVICDPRRPLLESQLHLTSLHAFLQSDRGKPFPVGELTVRAVNLDRESAGALGEPEGAAVLCLEHLFRDVDRRPVSWGWFLLRADLFQLRARLDLEQTGGQNLGNA